MVSNENSGYNPANASGSHHQHQKSSFKIDSANCVETENEILAQYDYRTTRITRQPSSQTVSNGPTTGGDKIDQRPLMTVKPVSTKITFCTKKKLPKLGLMMVGWGGNNGSTLTASIIANKKGISWKTRNGVQQPNYFGSILLSSTLRLGYDDSSNEPVYVPLRDVLPIVNPNDLVIGGWDISKCDLASAMQRAKVLEPDLQQQLMGEMSKLKPLPSVYYPDFIAANQQERADNLIEGTKGEQLEVLRQNIRSFKHDNSLDKVVVVWTANTERYSSIIDGVNDSSETLLGAIKRGHSEVSPSTIFGVAAVLEGCAFINGSPQNTFVPGLIQLAMEKGVHIGGDDFKSGQTKIKSVMVDFLVNAGIKPIAITSYNHLGNNDGKNLSAPQQFRSKEISKSTVVDDMVGGNSILYGESGSKPDHVVVIKYVPSVGDSKRALDEYENEIFMGGRNTISMHNTCEDSLLASPLIIDLVLMTELLGRISLKIDSTGSTDSISNKSNGGDFRHFHSVLSWLSYMLKAPLVPAGTPIVNALFRQRNAIENLFRACLGLSPESDLMLECRM